MIVALIADEGAVLAAEEGFCSASLSSAFVVACFY